MSHQAITEAVSYGHGAQARAASPLLRLEGVSKRFPGVRALDTINFDLRAGEIHVLFGENGAGKSTMISVIAGAIRPTEGRILVAGEPVDLHSVHEARERGISAVFQEFSLVAQMTVEQNLFLGAEDVRRGLLDNKAMHDRAGEILDDLGFPLNPLAKVAYLSRAEQQMLEIAKAFRTHLSVLILDEPTASLTEKETERLFTLMAQAKSDGVGIIYITHRMAEIKRIADRITVLRDGKSVATVAADDVTDDQLVHLMTGRVIDQLFPRIAFQPNAVILEARGLTTDRVRDVSFTARAGEIVGFAGLVGSGKSEVLRACFGVTPVVAGSVLFDGEDTTGLEVRDMLERGMFYVPPDRRDEGLVMVRSVRENMVLSSLGLRRLSGPLFLKRQEERKAAKALADRLNLVPPRVERPVDHFSGGNQQKVLVAKSLTRDVKLFVFDEPTVGVDVGTRAAIYEFIRDICESGAAVILVSSDLPEILHLCNRAYVMHRGALRAELKGEDITEENVLNHFFEEDAA